MIQQLGSIVAVTPPLAVGRHTSGRAARLRTWPIISPRGVLERAVPQATEQVRLSALLRCDVGLDDINERIFFPTKLVRSRLGLAVALAAGTTALVVDRLLDGLDASAVLAIAGTLRRLGADGIALYIVCRNESQASMLAEMLAVPADASALGVVRSRIDEISNSNAG